MRRRALGILVQVDAGAGFAADLLGPARAPFVRELVYGVLRRRLTLDTILGAFSSRPLDELDPEVTAALRIGLYQMLFMDGVPVHAAVSETVGALRMHSQRSFANGVLRAIDRESHRVPPQRDRGGASPTKRLERPGRSVTFFSRPVLPDPDQDRVAWLAAVHSHPPFLVERWLAREDEAAVVARMEADNRPAPLFLRPRAGRIDAAGLVAVLQQEDVPSAVRPRAGGAPAVEVPHTFAQVLSGPAFRRGLFAVQDLQQMDAAEILAPRAGEVVWDACAAPGGKTAQLAELLAGRGAVVATDASAERLLRIEETLARLGLEGVTTAVHDVLAGEPPPGRPERGFDAILLDAPCSNTAVLGRRPEARWRLRPDTFAELARLQAQLIDAVSGHLAPGGRLVYSVCSLEPEEGRDHGLAPTRSPLVFVAGGE